MSRLTDPTRCPDCRAPLDGDGTCRGCGLQLRGPLSQELWRTMVDADRLVERLRALSPAPVPVVAPDLGAAPPFPVAARDVPARARRVPAASVPVVLLTLGGLCLLVAAIVFVAVAWSLLGITGRTLVLVGFTGLMAILATLLTRRALRGAAETFWLVVGGMLVVDLLGAHAADLAGLGALDVRATGAVVGAALLAFGIGVGAWALAQPVSRLYGVEAVAVAGTLTLAASDVWGAARPAVATTVAIPVLVALFLLLRRTLPLSAYGIGVVGAVSWLVLLGIGWDRALESAGLATWWSHLRGWPLVVAAVYAAVATQAPRVPERLRALPAGLSLLALAVLADAPLTSGTPTHDVVIGSVVLVVLGAIAALAPRSWALGSGVLAGLGVLGSGIALALAPWDVLSQLDPQDAAPANLVLHGPADGAAPWTHLVLAAAVGAALVCLVRLAPESHRTTPASLVRAVAPATFALGALDLVLDLDPQLWVAVLAAGVAAALAGAATWAVREDTMAGWAGTAATAYLVVVTLWAASANDLLLALTMTVLFASFVVVHALRESGGSFVSATTSAVLAAVTGGAALVTWGVQLHVADDDTAVALAVYAAAVALLAAPLTRRTTSRVAFEVSAAVLALAAAAYPHDLHATASVLTVAGSAVCLLGVLHRDRDGLGWVGAMVLGNATLLRVALDVRAPELYTLPAAALLIAAGAWRLRTDPESGSARTLSSGLTLALLPSLLLALDEPISLRGALTAAAGVLALAAGVRLRLSAPFVAGAGTTGLLAVRHLEPYADAVPRWISLGAVGLALLLVGITWEARRRNLETAERYLTALR